MAYSYENNWLTCDGVSLEEIALSAGTPCYVYSASDILQRFRAYDEAFGDLAHQVCYAVKANSNLSVLRLLATAGSGFDIVSGGELFRVIEAGGEPSKVVFSGVGKTADEIEYALRNDVHIFNCESEPEVELIDAVAQRLNTAARVAFRVNPDVDAATHPYISTGMSDHKFGIDIAEVEAVYARAARFANLRVEGVSCHIGSQILDANPLLEAVDKMIALVDRLRSSGIPIRHLDFGGGIGVPYRPTDSAPEISDIIKSIREKVAGRDLVVSVEPGRSIVGEAGVLLTRVLYRKQTSSKYFVVVDAAMNDLIRPALYKSHHEIDPLRRSGGKRDLITADVVGPICETGDFLARDRDIETVEAGAFLAIRTAGAYGFVQASNYNSRPRSAEVMVENGSWRTVRARETYEDLIRGERIERARI